VNLRSYDRLAAALSVLLLVVLAGGSYYLAELAKRPSDVKAIDRTVHELDAYVERFSFTRIDEYGQPVYRLEAERAEHFPDDGSVELHQLRGTSLQRDRPTTTITANQGRADSEIKRIDLNGNVLVHRASDDQSAEWNIETTSAVLFTDTQIARTDQPVRITQGVSFLTGVGMELNNAERTLDVFTQVRGQYHHDTTTSSP
jgi:lipopolysaccharide export system protein LptC